MITTTRRPAQSPTVGDSRALPRVPGMTHRFITVRGVRLHVAEAGRGDPVLLLHSFPQHWYAWRHVVPQRRLLPQLWRFWFTAFWEYPRIGRLVLRHWPGLTRFLLRSGAAEPAAWPPGDVEEFVAASREPGSARAGEALHWQFVRHDIPAILLRRYRSARLTVPTVLLAGAEDWMLPPRLLAGAERHADDLELRVVPGAGHFLPAERPAVVAQVARELFRRP